MQTCSLVFLVFLFINIQPLFSQNESNKFFFIITKDGAEHIGNVERETESDLTLRLRNKEIIVISKTNIQLFEPVTEDNLFRGKYIHPNRSANRYLLGSSAISPGKNQLHFNTIYAFAGTLDYGINDVYSIGISSTVVGVPVLLNAQANYKIGDQFYWGVTATGGWLSWGDPSIFFGYGGVRLTSGSRSNNYTIGGGYFSLKADLPTPRPSAVSLGDFVYLNLSAVQRFRRKVSGLTEVWVMKNLYLKRSIYMANLGIKFRRRENAAWTFFASNIFLHEIRSGELNVIIIPGISWSRKLGKN